MVVVPEYANCKHGCKEGGIFPIHSKLDGHLYHFVNTGEPYMLRVCPKCKQASVIFWESH